MNESGSESREWVDVGTVWAQAEALSGRESFSGQQRYAEVDTRFLIRYLDDITPLHRILWRDRTYDVVAVLPTPAGRPDHLQILATARAE